MRRNTILTSSQTPRDSSSKDMAIEATPEVLNSLLAKLGAPACYKVGTTFMESVYGLWRQVEDVLGTEEAALASLPGLLRAVLVLVPRDEAYTSHRQQRDAEAGVGVDREQYRTVSTVSRCRSRTPASSSSSTRAPCAALRSSYMPWSLGEGSITRLLL